MFCIDICLVSQSVASFPLSCSCLLWALARPFSTGALWEKHRCMVGQTQVHHGTNTARNTNYGSALFIHQGTGSRLNR